MLESTVDADSTGHRLDQVLARLYPDWSRSQLQRWVKQERVTINGKTCRSREKLQFGDVIRLVPEETSESLEFDAEEVELNVVYEDDAVIVINKPPKLVVHPAPGNWGGTVLNGLLNRYPELQNIPRAGIVHRLDKDTSGLMVVARTLKAHKKLVDALQKRTVSRRYRALAQGSFVAGSTIEAPIGRHPQDRKKMAVVSSGKEAITHYRVAEKYPGYTLLDVWLETGRTHQIRVHLSHERHAIVGDQVYGGRLRLPKGVSDETKAAVAAYPRQALHAFELGIVHPVSGEEMSWQAPMPDDFQQLIEVMRQEAANHTED